MRCHRTIRGCLPVETQAAPQRVYKHLPYFIYTILHPHPPPHSSFLAPRGRPDDFDDGGGGHNDDEAPEVADDDVEAAGDGEAAAGEGSDSGDSLDRDLAHLLSNPNHRNVMASYSYSDDDN